MARDIERTLEFIVQSQAKAEVRMDRLEAQVKATADLVREGMKIVQALAKDQRETRQALRDLAKAHADLAKAQADLAKAQARTEATLNRYLRSLSNGHNGGGRQDS